MADIEKKIAELAALTWFYTRGDKTTGRRIRAALDELWAQEKELPDHRSSKSPVTVKWRLGAGSTRTKRERREIKVMRKPTAQETERKICTVFTVYKKSRVADLTPQDRRLKV